VDVVPVRRDGSGRLAAVGLIAVLDADREERWATITGTAAPGESIEDAIERSVRVVLGPAADARLWEHKPVGRTQSRQFMGGIGAPARREHEGMDVAYPVDLSGGLVPQGDARQFSWFLVSVLPPGRQLAAGTHAVLARFLEAEGEPGAAARLKRF
jgi:hypothetical protein